VAGKRRISGRDELSRSLLALRETAQLSQTDAGRQASITQRKLSRFEAGLYIPNPDELDALLRIYQTTPADVARLRELAEVRRTEGRKPRAVIRRLNSAAIQHDIRLLEEQAARIEAYHPATVLGLLQTPAYIRGVWGDVEGAADAV
jgi:transcriptional regulator with XRE-family HTH domain